MNINTKINTSKMNISKMSTRKMMLRDKYLYLMMLPGIITVIVFSYFPMYGVLMAFKDYKIRLGVMDSPWVGLKYFKQMFTMPDAHAVIMNTIIISVMTIVWSFPVPIILSLLLNELRNKVFKKSIQSILYLPHFISWPVISGLMFGFFSLTSGLVNKIILALGHTPINFLGNPDSFRSLLYLTNIWKGAGWGTIIYLAAIAGIDPSIYEAAKIDGAGRFKQMLHITLPSIRYTIVVLLILNIGGIMSTNFDQIYNLISPPVYGVGQTIDIYVYEQGVQGMNYSYSTAVGLFQQVIGFILLLLANYTSKLIGEDTFL